MKIDRRSLLIGAASLAIPTRTNAWLKPGTPIPGWTNAALMGPYPLISGLTNYTILTPNGASPVLSDLYSIRYHHHACTILTTNKSFIFYSCSGTNEDAGGQFVCGSFINKDGSGLSAPFVTMPPQSTWNGTGPSTPLGSRVSYPRCAVHYAGIDYVTMAVDDIVSGGRQGAALTACQVNDDGTIGSLFRISPVDYIPQTGFDPIPYDPILGPPLYAQSKLYGRFGGSQPGTIPSDWNAFLSQGGNVFTEPTTKALNAFGNYFVRFWRLTSGSGSGAFFWSQISYDGGDTWTAAIITTIPNSGSASWIGDISATRSCFSFNPQNGATDRDPLAVLIFNRITGNSFVINAIRQGVSPNPIYPGTNKSGGAQYPYFAADSINMWVGYDTQKETVFLTPVPISGLP